MPRWKIRSNDELLDAIDDALAQRLDGTPWALHDVSPAAGMSPGGLIKRFGSKEELALALTQRWVARIPEAPLDPGAGMTELRHYLETHFSVSSSINALSGLRTLVQGLGSAAVAASVRVGWDRQRSYIAQCLRSLPLRDGVDAEIAALTLLDGLHGHLFRQAVDLHPNTPTRILDDFVKLWR